MYRLLQFDGLLLPTATAESDISTANSAPALVVYPGGVHDADGSGRARREMPYQLSHRCELVSTDLTALRSELDQLRAERGVRGYLVRQAVDDDTEQWCFARLLKVTEMRTVRNVYVHPLQLDFLIESPWYGELYQVSVNFDASPTVVRLPHYGSAAIDHCIIAVWAGASGPLTHINVQSPGAYYEATVVGASIYPFGRAPDSDTAVRRIANSSFTYTGIVAATKGVIFDCGAWTVQNDGVSDPDHFFLDHDHETAGWLIIEPGGTTVRIEFVGTLGVSYGNAEFRYYEAWE